MTAWQRTALHVDPPLIQMADTDRETLDIPIGATVTTVTATIVAYADPETPLAGIIETTARNGTGDGALVTISGLTRGTTYELSVVGTTDDGRRLTSLLAIKAVA